MIEGKMVRKRKEKKEKFLKALLVESGVKSRACKLAGIRSRDTPYRWMREDDDFSRRVAQVYQRILVQKRRRLELSGVMKGKAADLIEYIEATSTNDENLRLAARLKELRKLRNARHGKRYSNGLNQPD